MRPKLSIVIAAWDGLEFVTMCIESIFKQTKGSFELILIDNASTDGSGEYCDFIAKKHPNVRVIHNKKNLGFGPAQNQGIGMATGEYVCALNSDVIVSPKWSDRLIECLDADREQPVAFVGPVSNSSAGRQMVPMGYRRLDDYPIYAEEWYKLKRRQWFEVGVLFGWCLLAKAEIWAEFKGFDTRFSNAFEDNDLCLRAMLKGYKLIVAGDVYMHHHGQGTILTHGSMEDYQKNGDIEKQKFVDKWRPKEKQKLVAVMRIANCERTIKRVLDRTAQFADEILVHLCRSTDGTERIVKNHPQVTWVESYDGPFQEDYERNRLLQIALQRQKEGRADWCISVDGDELYDHRMVERAQRYMSPEAEVVVLESV